jgi:hypothetical protein
MLLLPSKGQSLDEQLAAAVGSRGDRSREQPPSTPAGAAGPGDISAFSTPGIPMPPNPPPTPQGGIPIPPPPPPALPGGAAAQSTLKRVNWEKIHGTEGTIWREVSKKNTNYYTTQPHDLSSISHSYSSCSKY